MKLTGAQILIKCLEKEGVEHIFGLPGGVILPTYDVLFDSKIKLILTKHEQGATHMADGYARATGKPVAARAALRFTVLQSRPDRLYSR